MCGGGGGGRETERSFVKLTVTIKPVESFRRGKFGAQLYDEITILDFLGKELNHIYTVHTHTEGSRKDWAELYGV